MNTKHARPARVPWKQGILALAVWMNLGTAFSASAELPLSLRESEQWYQTGRLDEARTSATAFHHAFPKDIEGLLILTKVELESENLIEAKKWLRLADAIDRHHPLVIVYRRLLEDIEHRQGPITQMPEPLPTSDPTMTAVWFKRNWFWNRPTHLFPKVPVPPRSIPDDFGLATGPTGVLVSTSIVQEAEESFRRRQFLRAYLLFSDLVRDHPEELHFQLGKARAAMAIGLYEEARVILSALQKRYRFISGHPLLSPRVIRFPDRLP